MSLIKVNTIQNANGTTALTIAANGQLSSVNTAVANVTTLNATSGVLATQNGMTGIAKAWVNFVGSSGSVNNSYNVSSVTRSGGGSYIVNFTTAMPSANYATLVTAGNGGGTGQTSGQNYQSAAPTTSTVSIYCATNGVGNADPAFSGQMNCAIFSS